MTGIGEGKMKLYSVLTDDLERCAVTGSCHVEYHHVFNGANRKNSEKYGFILPLRPDWHNMTAYSVHIDQRLDERLKRQAQAYYEAHYGSREDFRREFGKSYL